jgi:hypothetical protein
VYYGFLSPLKIHRLVQVWTHEPWVQWQTLTFTSPRRPSDSLLSGSSKLEAENFLASWATAIMSRRILLHLVS